uniref:Uncharacterized protein n=1 Tax=Trypanosoma congolense (strain IL3000) TaxID=1068625 RepID=G0UK04_TRYCI|nr:conserved hypothetical protein [Trypanosoma congolense IL3000]
MTVRKETESVLAIVDEVISSLGSCTVMNPMPEEDTAIVNLIASRNDKVSHYTQTEIFTSNKSVQQCIPTLCVGVQTARQEVNCGSQTTLSTVCSSTQTDQINTLESVKATVMESVSKYMFGIDGVELSLNNLMSRVVCCSTNLRRVSDFVSELSLSRRSLQMEVRRLKLVSAMTSLAHDEKEARDNLCEDEHILRGGMLLSLFGEINNFHRKNEAILSETRNELFRKEEYIDDLKRRLQEVELPLCRSDTDIDEYAKCCSEGISVVESGRYVKDIEVLLGECLALLRQEV